MLKSTRILLEPVGKYYALKKQPKGYTEPTQYLVECYNRWANASKEYYDIWNAEFEELYPEYEYSEFIEDMPEYNAYLLERIPAAWNVVNKGHIILRRVTNYGSDWHWYQPI